MNTFELSIIFLAGVTLVAGGVTVVLLGWFILVRQDQEYRKKYQEFLKLRSRVRDMET